MGILDVFKPSPKYDSGFDERLKSVESQIRLIEAEWSEMYGKIMHAINRVNKRQERETAKQGENNEDPMAELYKRARNQGLL